MCISFHASSQLLKMFLLFHCIVKVRIPHSLMAATKQKTTTTTADVITSHLIVKFRYTSALLRPCAISRFFLSFLRARETFAIFFTPFTTLHQNNEASSGDQLGITPTFCQKTPWGDLIEKPYSVCVFVLLSFRRRWLVAFWLC